MVTTVGLIDGPTADDDTVDCADECAAWDSSYQREIIDGVTVYYGGDLCDSEELDCEDPFDIAGREYVDQYNFEGMEPMVLVPGGDPSRSDLRDDVGTGLAHVCQTTLYGPQGGLDEVDVVANALGQEFPGISWGVSTDSCGGNGIFEDETLLDGEGDVRGSDDGSIVDRERNTWVDWCDSTFRNGLDPFPSDVDDPRPMVVFRDKLFPDEEWADTSVLARDDVGLCWHLRKI